MRYCTIPGVILESGVIKGQSGNSKKMFVFLLTLIYSKLLDDPILARTILEKILEKPLSPKAIALIPNT